VQEGQNQNKSSSSIADSYHRRIIEFDERYEGMKKEAKEINEIADKFQTFISKIKTVNLSDLENQTLSP
jgi:hypothetical protein